MYVPATVQRLTAATGNDLDGHAIEAAGMIFLGEACECHLPCLQTVEQRVHTMIACRAAFCKKQDQSADTAGTWCMFVCGQMRWYGSERLCVMTAMFGDLACTYGNQPGGLSCTVRMCCSLTGRSCAHVSSSEQQSMASAPLANNHGVESTALMILRTSIKSSSSDATKMPAPARAAKARPAFRAVGLACKVKQRPL